MSNGNDPDAAHAMYLSMELGDQQITKDEAEARLEQAKWIAEGHTGISPIALQKFGNALHIITDRLSPAHVGYQPWYGQSKWNPSAWWHALSELPWQSSINPTVGEAQNAFRETFGFDPFDLMQLQQQRPEIAEKIFYSCQYDSDGNMQCH
jgi:hypothetical protein